MLENKERTELTTLGEFGLIKHLTEHVEIHNESSIKGIGDDAAVIKYENEILRTFIFMGILLNYDNWSKSNYTTVHYEKYLKIQNRYKDFKFDVIFLKI